MEPVFLAFIALFAGYIFIRNMLICTCLILIVGCASPRKYKESPFTKQSQQEDSVFNIGYGRKWLQDHGIIQ